MKRKTIGVMTVFLAICLGVVAAWADTKMTPNQIYAPKWEHKTKCGILVIASSETIVQYDLYHAPKPWETINWENLCTEFKTQKALFRAAKIKHIVGVNPSGVRVVVKHWEWFTRPDSTRVPVIKTWWGAQAQAASTAWMRAIEMSLSLDDGQGAQAMCISPYRHEVNHIILSDAKHECSGLGEGGDLSCTKWDLSGVCP